MRSRTPLLAACLAALSLSLAACGGTGQQSSGAASDEDSPLAKMYRSVSAQASKTQNELQAEYREQEQKRQDLMAACMSTLGFEYTPVVQHRMSIVGPGPSSSEDPIEFAQQNGYGYTTFPDESADAGDDQASAPEDPNQTRYEAMSDSEKLAFNTALWGDQTEPTAAEKEEPSREYTWQDAGCSGKADRELGLDKTQDTSPYEDPQWAGLIEKMNSIYDQIPDMPKMTELNQSWASCMADNKYPDFKKPFDAMDYIANKSTEIWDPETGEVIKERRAEIQKEEIKLAVTDATCQKKVDYIGQGMQLQFQLEQDFIDANKAELDAFLAAIQASETK